MSTVRVPASWCELSTLSPRHREAGEVIFFEDNASNNEPTPMLKTKYLHYPIFGSTAPGSLTLKLGYFVGQADASSGCPSKLSFNDIDFKNGIIKAAAFHGIFKNAAAKPPPNVLLALLATLGIPTCFGAKVWRVVATRVTSAIDRFGPNGVSSFEVTSIPGGRRMGWTSVINAAQAIHAQEGMFEAPFPGETASSTATPSEVISPAITIDKGVASPLIQPVSTPATTTPLGAPFTRVGLAKRAELYSGDIQGLKKTTAVHGSDNENIMKTAVVDDADINELQMTSAVHSADIYDLQKTTAVHGTDINGLQETAAAHGTDIHDLKKTTTDHRADFNVLKKTTAKQGEKVVDLATEAQVHASNINDIKATTAKHASNMDVLNKFNAAHAKQLSKHDIDIGNLYEASTVHSKTLKDHASAMASNHIDITAELEKYKQQFAKHGINTNAAFKKQDERLTQHDERLTSYDIKTDAALKKQDERLTQYDINTTGAFKKQDERLAQHDERLTKQEECLAKQDARLNKVTSATSATTTPSLQDWRNLMNTTMPELVRSIAKQGRTLNKNTADISRLSAQSSSDISTLGQDFSLFATKTDHRVEDHDRQIRNLHKKQEDLVGHVDRVVKVVGMM